MKEFERALRVTWSTFSSFYSDKKHLLGPFFLWRVLPKRLPQHRCSRNLPHLWGLLLCVCASPHHLIAYHTAPHEKKSLSPSTPGNTFHDIPQLKIQKQREAFFFQDEIFIVYHLEKSYRIIRSFFGLVERTFTEPQAGLNI